MLLQSRRGDSLIELLVAVLLLEVAGTAALAAALTAESLGRRAMRGAADDAARWMAYRTAELAPACADSMPPRAVPLQFDATPARPALSLILRCGR